MSAAEPLRPPTRSPAVAAEDLPLQRAYRWEKEYAREVFLTQPRDGEVRDWTWAQALDEARRMAAHLSAQGWPPGSSIALMAKNCAWWIMADLAIWMSGHVSVPIYPSLAGTSVRKILEHSNARACIVGRLDDQALSLMAGREGGKEIRLQRVDVAKLEVSERRGTRGKWIGIGFLAGVAVGTAIGAATEQDCGPKPSRADLGNLSSTLCHNLNGMNTFGGAVLGATAGSLLGLAVSNGEKWEVASLDKVRLTGGWSRRGVGLSLSFGF